MAIGDNKTLLRFKKLYDEAVQNGAYMFMFDDVEVLVDFAKHLIEASERKLS